MIGGRKGVKVIEVSRDQLDMIITIVQAFNSLTIPQQKSLVEGYDIDIDSEVTHDLEEELRDLF